MMLIFALVLIFLVCLAVFVHFYLKRKRRRRRASNKPKKKPAGKPAKKSSTAQQEPEPQAQERKFAELVGTPLCEMGESEPRHEMEDVEVHERYVMPENWPLTNPADNPVLVSPLDPDLEAGTMTFGEMTIDSTYQPYAAVSAAYWARAI